IRATVEATTRRGLRLVNEATGEQHRAEVTRGASLGDADVTDHSAVAVLQVVQEPPGGVQRHELGVPGRSGRRVLAGPLAGLLRSLRAASLLQVLGLSQARRGPAQDRLREAALDGFLGLAVLIVQLVQEVPERVVLVGPGGL